MNKYSGLILRPSGEFRKNSACISLVIDKDKTSYEALLALSVMLKVSSNAYKDERGYKLRLMNLFQKQKRTSKTHLLPSTTML